MLTTVPALLLIPLSMYQEAPQRQATWYFSHQQHRQTSTAVGHHQQAARLTVIQSLIRNAGEHWSLSVPLICSLCVSGLYAVSSCQQVRACLCYAEMHLSSAAGGEKLFGWKQKSGWNGGVFNQWPPCGGGGFFNGNGANWFGLTCDDLVVTEL